MKRSTIRLLSYLLCCLRLWSNALQILPSVRKLHPCLRCLPVVSVHPPPSLGGLEHPDSLLKSRHQLWDCLAFLEGVVGDFENLLSMSLSCWSRDPPPAKGSWGTLEYLYSWSHLSISSACLYGNSDLAARFASSQVTELKIDCRLLMGLHGLLGVLHQNVITSNSRGGMLPGLETTGRAGNYEVPLKRLPS
jgi:hypothetical protein